MDQPLETLTPETSRNVPLDRAGLLQVIRQQVEYYLSDDNLPRDVFLLKQIEKDKTKEGYVSLKVIAGFPKMKQLTHDLGAIREAVEDSEFVLLSGDGLSVKRKVPLVLPEDTTEKRTLYVTRLPKECDRETLMVLFSEFGTVVRLDLPVDKKSGEHKGMAFVEYNTEEEVKRALEEVTNSGKYKMVAKPFKSKNSKEPKSPSEAEEHGEEEESPRKAGAKKRGSKEVKNPEKQEKRTSKEIKDQNGGKRTSREFTASGQEGKRTSREFTAQENKRSSKEGADLAKEGKRSSKDGSELVKDGKRSSKEAADLAKEGKRSVAEGKRTSKEFKTNSDVTKEKRTSKEIKDRRISKEFKPFSPENGTGREVPDSSYDGQNLSSRSRGGSRSGRNSGGYGEWEPAEPSFGRPKFGKPAEEKPLFAPVRNPVGPPSDNSRGFSAGRGKIIMS